MQFSILSNDLKKCVELVDKFVSTRQVMPVIGNIRIECKGGNVNFYGTDLDTSIKMEVPLAENTDVMDGDVTVESAALVAFMKTVPANTPCRIVMDGTIFKLDTKIGDAGFKTIPVENYPPFKWERSEDVVLFKGNSPELQLMLDSTVIAAMERPEERPNLNCICFDGVNRNITATNTFIMSLWNKVLLPIELPEGIENDQYGSAPYRYLAPKAGIVKLRNVLGAAGLDANVHVSASGTSSLVFAITDGNVFDVSVGVQLVDALYPSYERIIPQNPTLGVHLDNKEFQRLLKATSVFAPANRAMELTVARDRIRIESQSIERGTWDGEMEPFRVDELTEPLTDDFHIMLNVDYMLNIVETLKSDTVILWFTDNRRPVGISSSSDWEQAEFKHIVMPVTIPVKSSAPAPAEQE